MSASSVAWPKNGSNLSVSIRSTRSADLINFDRFCKWRLSVAIAVSFKSKLCNAKVTRQFGLEENFEKKNFSLEKSLFTSSSDGMQALKFWDSSISTGNTRFSNDIRMSTNKWKRTLLGVHIQASEEKSSESEVRISDRYLIDRCRLLWVPC